MKRYSSIWILVVAMKLAAIFLFVVELEWMIPQFLQESSVRGPLLRNAFHLLAQSVTWWGVAEALRLIANTEAYARGTYGIFRRRAERQREIAEQADRFRPTTEITYTPPPEYRRRLRRWNPDRVASFREREPLSVRRPLPSGETTVYDSLDVAGSDHLPFDAL